MRHISLLNYVFSLYHLWLQILLDDVKVSEQLLDLVFYILIVFSGYEQVWVNPLLLFMLLSRYLY